jgi:hypothetical protein
MLEWFLKSLLPYISKDVSTSGVTSEEEVIFKAQHLDLIYAQSGMLYEILPNMSRSNYDPRKNPGPHANGIIGSANAKVEAILQLPPPCNIRQLQGLQGKANFLRRFILNYANLTKGFMCLLKKDTSFIWDERAQESFNALKKALVSTPLLKLPDYSRDYFLYIATYEGMVVVVLVQEDDEVHDHIVYYLVQNLVGPKLKYSHVEKLTLVVIHVVQILR